MSFRRTSCEPQWKSWGGRCWERAESTTARSSRRGWNCCTRRTRSVHLHSWKPQQGSTHWSYLVQSTIQSVGCFSVLFIFSLVFSTYRSSACRYMDLRCAYSWCESVLLTDACVSVITGNRFACEHLPCLSAEKHILLFPEHLQRIRDLEDKTEIQRRQIKDLEEKVGHGWMFY